MTGWEKTYWIKCLEWVTGTGNLCTSKQCDVLDVADLDHWQLHGRGQFVVRLRWWANFQRAVWDQNHMVCRNDKLVAAQANSLAGAIEHVFLLHLRKCACVAKQHPWPQSELMWCIAMPLNVQRTQGMQKEKPRNATKFGPSSDPDRRMQRPLMGSLSKTPLIEGNQTLIFQTCTENYPAFVQMTVCKEDQVRVLLVAFVQNLLRANHPLFIKSTLKNFLPLTKDW